MLFSCTHVQANAQQEKEHQEEEGGADVKEEVEAEAEGSEEYNPDEEYDPAAGVADSKPSSLAKQFSIAPSASGRRGEKVTSPPLSSVNSELRRKYRLRGLG